MFWHVFPLIVAIRLEMFFVLFCFFSVSVIHSYMSHVRLSKIQKRKKKVLFVFFHEHCQEQRPLTCCVTLPSLLPKAALITSPSFYLSPRQLPSSPFLFFSQLGDSPGRSLSQQRLQHGMSVLLDILYMDIYVYTRMQMHLVMCQGKDSPSAADSLDHLKPQNRSIYCGNV